MAEKRSHAKTSAKEDQVHDIPEEATAPLSNEQTAQLRNSLRHAVISAIRLWRQEQGALLEGRSEQEVAGLIGEVVGLPPVG